MTVLMSSTVNSQVSLEQSPEERCLKGYTYCPFTSQLEYLLFIHENGVLIFGKAGSLLFKFWWQQIGIAFE